MIRHGPRMQINHVRPSKVADKIALKVIQRDNVTGRRIRGFHEGYSYFL